MSVAEETALRFCLAETSPPAGQQSEGERELQRETRRKATIAKYSNEVRGEIPVVRTPGEILSAAQNSLKLRQLAKLDCIDRPYVHCGRGYAF